MLKLLDELLVRLEELGGVHERGQLEDALLLLLVDTVILSDLVGEFIVREGSRV